MKKILMLMIGLLMFGVNASAAPGDLVVGGNASIMSSATISGNATVNGILSVGTTTPTQKLNVNGNVKATGFCIGSNCTSTLHVSGGLYGICSEDQYCNQAKAPAACNSGLCTCPSGYTAVATGTGGNSTYAFVSCYKN